MPEEVQFAVIARPVISEAILIRVCKKESTRSIIPNARNMVARSVANMVARSVANMVEGARS